eukprot:5706524-Pyramimonas_sp.AAC.1
MAASAHSRTQAGPATPSTEADVYAAGPGACEGLFVTSSLEELLPGTQVSLQLGSDSSTSVSSQIRLGSGKLKRVHLRSMFAQGLLREGRMMVHKIPTRPTAAIWALSIWRRGEFEKNANGLS